MTKFFLVCSLLVAFLCSSSFAYVGKPGEPSLSTVKFLLDTNQMRGDVTKLGTQLTRHKVQLMTGQYDFAKQGGASVLSPSAFGLILMDADGKDAVLPTNAVVKMVTLDVITPFTASATSGFTLPQVSFGVNTPSDLFPSTLATTITGFQAGTPANTVGTFVKVKRVQPSAPYNPSVLGTPDKGNSALVMNIVRGSVLSGKVNVFVEFYLSD